MQIQITVKIVDAEDAGKPGEPSRELVAEFVQAMQGIEGVTVKVE